MGVVQNGHRWLVTWEIDVEDAVSPLAAARKARLAQTRPGTEAVVFTVGDVESDEMWRVDLLDGTTTLISATPLEQPVQATAPQQHGGIAPVQWKAG